MTSEREDLQLFYLNLKTNLVNIFIAKIILKLKEN